MILKMQRPIMDSDGDYNQIMVYDKKRIVDDIVRVHPDTIKELFDDDEYKIYVYGRINEYSEVVVEGLAEEQDW